MVNYRQRIDIIANILEITSLDAKKTQIMFKANLSYKALTKYLFEVLNAGLVIYKQDSQCYTVTDKGRNFLETYRRYRKTNLHLEKRLNHLTDTKKALDDLCPISSN